MNHHAHRQLLLGMASLFIVMAIGRFAYTPILPFMQHAEHMSDQAAGLLATINYLGYLIGAIIPMFFIFKSKVVDVKIYLILNILSIILMGFTTNYILWSVLRLIAGITSGTVFVLASNVVLEALRQAHKEGISGLLYSVVGLGLFSSSIYVFFFTDESTWQMTWIILGAFSLILGLLVIFFMKENPPVESHSSNNTESKTSHRLNPTFMRWFSIAYFCEGAGYIITGTFLVAIIKSIPAFSEYAALSWMFVGLGAIPSTVVWSMIAEKLDYSKATYMAFGLQIISVCLPVISHDIVSLIISSLLFGSTFLGLTTLFMSKGQMLMFQTGSKSNFIATLTVIYSIGQMIAPFVSGYLIGESGNYNSALLFATVILIIGLVSSWISYRALQKEKKRFKVFFYDKREWI
ncbi:YbfB/YjiJ family MFS transporter [Staphylococcus carnosus]|uniref:MFS transporter permease n=1 Tax=Staphylococcus carnosus TaxID=1281 RepID=A0AAJ0NH53_STACA|nr:YbfB/YjiJ family MFS transporter [Staphylococcus carnosus]KKB25648.1 MFS transporter permease [Staphylococcus carnosus]POA01929.1 MFS transporter [Staphylococcus carnosus]QQS84165.1 YbfB/YjiJ family MFS transporter [Staphylococcus carnosus]QRQ04104.1 YbfB/YjiJ family MFS transporter [Staphylococcus carnosus]UTB83895.1 MFS transporter permease [Staphylococcus carnosus]